jgi:hypothetical protein
MPPAFNLSQDQTLHFKNQHNTAACHSAHHRIAPFSFRQSINASTLTNYLLYFVKEQEKQ